MSYPQDIDEQLRDHLPRLRRFALWLTRDADSADDLVQSTLEKAITRWSGRRESGSLKAWLFAIAYRRFIDTRRRAKRQAWLLDRLRGEVETAPSAERETMARSTLEAFERLPPKQRSLLLWVSVEGLSYREVAAILEVPLGTVMSRLSRARQALRRMSEGEEPTPSLRLLKK